MRKSEITEKEKNPVEQSKQLRMIDQVFLNLGSGQQCVRDFFLCLSENANCWIDLYEFLCFQTTDSTTCVQCGNRNETYQQSMYVDMDVPPEGSTLSNFVEKRFNDNYLVDYTCEACKKKSQAEKHLALNSVDMTHFIIVVLRRSIIGDEGRMIVNNRIDAAQDVKL